MKNPLVDAMRQSSGNDQALSDSGSFDTTETKFGPTANDSQIEAVNDAELELLESTGAIILDDGTISFQVHQPGDDLAAIADPTKSELTDFDPERAPAMSRLAPVICVVAALLAAGGWGAYTTLQSYGAENSMGSNDRSAAMTSAADIAGTVRLAGAERFPFINPNGQGEAGGSE